MLRALEGLRGLREPDVDPFRPEHACGEPDAALTERVAELLSPRPVSRDELVRAT